MMEINEKLAQIKAVPLYTKESVHTIKHIFIGQLRMLFKDEARQVWTIFKPIKARIVEISYLPRK